MYKRYPKDFLLDTSNEINHRIELINNFDCNKYKALVKTEIVLIEEEYVYKQKFQLIKKSKTLKKDDFFDLVTALDYFQSLGFIHGDLNRKNIIYTEHGFKIIDYEPSLLQIKNGVKQLMITIPYVDKNELKNMLITSKTDKIGFFYFILRVNNAFASIDIVRLSKNLDHDKVIKEDINSLTYREILDLAYLRLQK